METVQRAAVADHWWRLGFEDKGIVKFFIRVVDFIIFVFCCWCKSRESWNSHHIMISVIILPSCSCFLVLKDIGVSCKNFAIESFVVELVKNFAGLFFGFICCIINSGDFPADRNHTYMTWKLELYHRFLHEYLLDKVVKKRKNC